MSYLRQLCRYLQIIFLKLDWLPARVSPSEPISRFIFSRDHVKTGGVSFAAFMPSPRTHDTSVYRIRDCSERRIWLLGDLFVARKRKDNKMVLARADLTSQSVLKERLEVRPDPSPHPRHANITTWPTDKPQQKIKALALAQSAELRRRSDMGVETKSVHG